MNMLETKAKIEEMMNNEKIDLIWIDYAIAYRIRDTVYMNKNLLDYKPEYAMTVALHELGHKNTNTLSQDIQHEMNDTNTGENLKFMARYPRALMSMIPIAFHNGDIAIDWTYLITYIVFIIFIIWVLIWMI